MTTQTEALKLALEALKRITHRFDLESVTEDATKAIIAAEEALAHPEQEPVPDLYVKDINGNFHSYKEKGHTVSSQCVPPSHVGVGEDDFTPQRKPLTDDELDLMCEKALFCRISFQQFARSIEAAHGIKE